MKKRSEAEASESQGAARDRFGWIQRVVRDFKLHPNARLLAVVIADFINSKSGVAYPSQKRLAEILGLSTRTIMNLLPQIVERGHIEITPGNGRGHASEYRLKDEADFTLFYAKGCNAVHPSQSERVKPDALKGEIRRRERVKPASHQPVEYNQLKEPVEYIHGTFDEFWEVYPRRVSRGAAQRAFQKALKRSQAKVIMDGATRYAIERKGQDTKYTKHPATWLNGDCWEDEPDIRRQKRTGASGLADDLIEEMGEER
ncbi:MAG: helix-turn-helix domain-containing protein [Micropepsaceae bacterium]